jgi:hypothetical protein
MSFTITRRVINIIPADYRGNPRNALGYAWQHLAWRDGRKIDEECVPGDDRIGYEQDAVVRAEIAAQHPGVEWTNDWMLIPVGATRVALINHMWCGGCTSHGYLSDEHQQAPITPGIVSAGEEPCETAAIVATQECIELADIDIRNSHHSGWCNK